MLFFSECVPSRHVSACTHMLFPPGVSCVRVVLVKWCSVVSVSLSSVSRVKWQVSWSFRSGKSLFAMPTLNQGASYVLGTVETALRGGGTYRTLGTGVPGKIWRSSKPDFFPSLYFSFSASPRTIPTNFSFSLTHDPSDEIVWPEGDDALPPDAQDLTSKLLHQNPLERLGTSKLGFSLVSHHLGRGQGGWVCVP